MIVPMLPCVKIQNVEIHVKHLEFVVKMQFVVLLDILQLVDVHQMLKEIQKFHVISSSVQTIMSVISKNLVSTQNASIHAHYKTRAVRMQFAQLIITLEFVHVNRERLEILYLAALKFNIAAPIINVPRARNVTMEYAQQFAQARVTASAISCV